MMAKIRYVWIFHVDVVGKDVCPRPYVRRKHRIHFIETKPGQPNYKQRTAFAMDGLDFLFQQIQLVAYIRLPQ